MNNCALDSRRVGTKRAKCMTRTTRTYYKRLQATRQKSIHDIADGILVIHILCCFDLFDVHEWLECMDDTNCIVDEDVQGRLSECMGNSMEVGVFTEPEYMVVSEEKEYQQVQGLPMDPTGGSSNDDFQEAPLTDNVSAQLSVG